MADIDFKTVIAGKELGEIRVSELPDLARKTLTNGILLFLAEDVVERQENAVERQKGIPAGLVAAIEMWAEQNDCPPSEVAMRLIEMRLIEVGLATKTER